MSKLLNGPTGPAELYRVTNFAIFSITEAIAFNITLFGVRVNTLSPTIMDKRLAGPMFRMQKVHTLIRLLLTDEQKADLILSASSPESSLSSGQTVFIDGSLEEK